MKERIHYKVVDESGFVPVNGNPDHLRYDFGAEREDLSKNWSSTKSHFLGSIELRRVVDKDEVKLVLTHTSHEFIFLHRVDARYKFDVSGVMGSCVVTMHFPEYSRGKQAKSEMEINIKFISFDNSSRGITKTEVKEKLLDELESQKAEKYRAMLFNLELA